MQVERLSRLTAKLEAMKKQAAANSRESVVVGYTQRYALVVHEDLTARHASGKQAKYLEDPARRLRTEIASLVGQAYKRTGNLSQALLMGGLRILRESQQIVPIDTAALKASGYIAFESEHDAKAAAAFFGSEAIRVAKTRSRITKSVAKRDKAILKARGKRIKSAADKEQRRRDRLKRRKSR